MQFRLVRPTSEFFTYTPDEEFIRDDWPACTVLCKIKNDKSGCSGEFRPSLRGKNRIRIQLNLETLFGQDFLPGYVILIDKFPQDLEFETNTWHTNWISVNDEILADAVVIEAIQESSESRSHLLSRLKEALIASGLHASIRMELVTAPNDSSIWLKIRGLPAAKAILEGNVRLNNNDVASMDLGVIDCNFIQRLQGMNDKIPFTPILCTDHNLSEEEFFRCVNQNFHEIFSGMVAHKDLTLPAARKYVLSPTSTSGNFLRHRWARKRRNNDPAGPGFVRHDVSGTCKMSKFGTKKRIFEYIHDIPDSARKYICLSNTSPSWDSYMTAWKTYDEYCTIRHIENTLPVNRNTLLDYIVFLREEACLEKSTISSYITALKQLHNLNNLPVTCFDDPLVKSTLKGIENVARVLNKPGLERSVITWNVLQVLGFFLHKSQQLCAFDIQVIWTVCVIGYFGAFRMGELLPSTLSDIDIVRLITWRKIRRVESDHYVILSLLPKVSEDSRGDVVDLFRFTTNKSFCPIYNIDKLKNMCSRKELDDAAFRFYNGDLLSMKYLNEILHMTLGPIFPQTKFSCHSFRAGVTALMAAHQDHFSKYDARIVGRWRSEAVKKYQRQKGIAQKTAFKKLDNFLQVFIF